MPLYYENTASVSSRADLPLGGQDWAQGDVQTLILYFMGVRGNTGGKLFVEVDGKRIANPSSLSLGLRKRWNIDLGAPGVTTQNWLGDSQWTADGFPMERVDEFRIYHRALSGGEIRYLAGDR